MFTRESVINKEVFVKHEQAPTAPQTRRGMFLCDFKYILMKTFEFLAKPIGPKPFWVGALKGYFVMQKIFYLYARNNYWCPCIMIPQHKIIVMCLQCIAKFYMCMYSLHKLT